MVTINSTELSTVFICGCAAGRMCIEDEPLLRARFFWRYLGVERLGKVNLSVRWETYNGDDDTMTSYMSIEFQRLGAMKVQTRMFHELSFVSKV